MDQVMVSGDVILIDVMIYWFFSAIAMVIVDVYAKRRLGGKKSPAYEPLRMSKLFMISTVSVISILIILITGRTDISFTMSTFIALPYAVIWMSYLISVFRRLRAEKNVSGRLLDKNKD